MGENGKKEIKQWNLRDTFGAVYIVYMRRHGVETDKSSVRPYLPSPSQQVISYTLFDGPPS